MNSGAFQILYDRLKVGIELNTSVMFSSESNEYETPQGFFNLLDEEFNFTLDPCATPHNTKCKKYYTIKEDGLKQDWRGQTVFCNPPYGREIGKWVQKAYQEAKKYGVTVVMLIPARTDTAYFHDYIYHKAKEIRFIRGRLKFENTANSAPFPSMVVIF